MRTGVAARRVWEVAGRAASSSRSRKSSGRSIAALDLGGGVTLGPVDVDTVDLPPGVDGALGNDLVANKAVTVDYERGVSDAIDEASMTAIGPMDPSTLAAADLFAPF